MMDKKLVALVTPLYPPAVGGVERMAEATAQQLQARGYQVEVITTAPWSRRAYREVRDGVNIRRFPTIAGDNIYFISPELTAWLTRYAGHFDLVHAYSYHTPLALAAAAACTIAGRPFVVTPVYHGGGHTSVRSALHVPYRAFGAWMLRQAGAIGCISEAERGLLTSHFGSELPTAITFPGIEVDEIRGAAPLPRDTSRPLVVTAGRLVDYKRVDRVIDAAAEMPFAAELVVLGEGPARESLAARVAASPARERIHLLGQVSRGDLLGWLRTADVFISLSEREAFGLSVLEAATAGAAIIASDLPSHREIAGFTDGQRFELIPNDATIGETSLAMNRALQRGRISSTSRWPIPTWPGHADAVLRMYQAANPAFTQETRLEQAA